MAERMPKEMEKPVKEAGGEKTFTKALNYTSHGIGSALTRVDVKNGRIVRIKPFYYDAKYKPEEFNPWKLEARGKVFKVPLKTMIPPFSLAYKKRVYSPNRIEYPLQRVDFDPGGERHPENRGKSKFKRITWDEATDIIAGEIKRIVEKYGPYAILAQVGNHGEGKTVHAAHGCMTRLLHLLGGYTLQITNADSWEGFFWGAKHMWGMAPVGRGHMTPQTNLFKDVSENTEMILFWGCDPETTPWGFNGQLASRLHFWFTELGIKSIYICPDLNYGAAVHADKWIPVLPNTDAALHLAISYVWMTEGIYYKEYIATHAYGFDKFENYVLGKEDGIPKTPGWASPLCGVPEWTIKALARQWASMVTSIEHNYGGSYIRASYAHEPGRLEVCNLAMQGLGKPGANQVNGAAAMCAPSNGSCLPPPIVMPSVRAAYRELIEKRDSGKDPYLWKTHVARAILSPPFSWYGTGQIAPTEDQFVRGEYPMKGCSEIHMLWSDSPCWTTCWNGGNEMIEAYRSPKVEFHLVQHPWMEDDCLFADIILPSNTKLEENDIMTDTVSGQFATIFLEGQCIEPIGESMSDYEVVGEIAKKLGLYEEYTGGKTVEEWIRVGYETSGVQDMVSWQELNQKGYYVVPTDPGWKKQKPGLIDFYEDPEGNPLTTPTGKLEFYATALAEHFPDDVERPPVPHWIPFGDSHGESLLHPRAKQYPLLIVSNHPRWRMHAEHDDISWLREIPTCKVKGPDGYLYEPLWINPEDAVSRGIENGDIVKIYNERGAVLGGAYVTERIMPGAVYQDHGARLDPIILGELDRGGANNLICPTNTTSRNCAGEVTSGYLVEVEKVSMSQMDEWQKQYPEAFQREYDPASGLHFNAWVEGGM